MESRAPAIGHLLETALYGDDLARTAAFYSRPLDREPMSAGERRSVELATPGTWPRY